MDVEEEVMNLIGSRVRTWDGIRGKKRGVQMMQIKYLYKILKFFHLKY